MTLLEFAHKIEDVIQRKSTDDREEDSNKMPYIKEIQL